MNTLKDLTTYCKKKIMEHPNLATEIKSFYDLAVTEIEDGESETGEVWKAYDDIEDMIKSES